MPTSPTSSPKTSSSAGPTGHSSLVGGSTASRRLGCHASYQEEQKVPQHLKDKSSSYADEGTALHAVMQFIYENGLYEDDLETQVLGREFEGYVITQKHVDEAIIPCMDYIDILMEKYADEGEFIIELETRCEMPGISGAFGTTDFLFRTNKRTGILDYKFGAGVPVKAFYIESDGTKKGNAQLLFYGRAALNTVPHMFGSNPDWPVELHILQPLARDAEFEDKFTSFDCDVIELEIFRNDLIKAIEAGQKPGPNHRKGPWCRFASCKSVCPLHLQPLVDMARLATLKQQPTAQNDDKFDEHLGMVLELWEMAEAVGKAALAQAQAHLENGGNVIDPITGERGWKLVPKRGQEKIVDEEGLVKHVRFVGVPEDKIYEPREARSAAQLGKEMIDFITHDKDGNPIKTKKDREAEARRQLREFTVTASSGNTLARFDDKRPEVMPTTGLIDKLASKLALLQQK